MNFRQYIFPARQFLCEITAVHVRKSRIETGTLFNGDDDSKSGTVPANRERLVTLRICVGHLCTDEVQKD